MRSLQDQQNCKHNQIFLSQRKMGNGKKEMLRVFKRVGKWTLEDSWHRPSGRTAGTVCVRVRVCVLTLYIHVPWSNSFQEFIWGSNWTGRKSDRWRWHSFIADETFLGGCSLEVGPPGFSLPGEKVHLSEIADSEVVWCWGREERGLFNPFPPASEPCRPTTVTRPSASAPLCGREQGCYIDSGSSAGKHGEERINVPGP